MAEQGSGYIESLINEIGEMAPYDVSLSPATEAVADDPDCLISLVKEETRAVDPYEYAPRKVHVGPYYRYDYRRSDPHSRMEQQKKELLHGFVSRDGPVSQGKLRGYLLTVAEGVEGRARQYYHNTFNNMSKDEFACILLLDGCYLLSRFVPVMGSGVPNEDIEVVRDVVFLLENQIPFFVLEEIHKLITAGAEDDDSFVLSSVAGHVEKLVRRNGYSAATLELELDPPPRRPCHLLHLLYMYFRPTALDVPATQTSSAAAPTPATATATARDDIQLTVNDHNHLSINGNGAVDGSTSGARAREDDMPTHVPPARWRAATYYHVAGVRLVKRDLDGMKARSVLDVELAGGTLHVPRLMIDTSTLTILRNMVALEQNSPRLGSHVTDYCLFMSHMASTEKDVALLVAKGILMHFLGSDAEVAAGFANLCKGIHIDVDKDFSYLRAEQEALERLSWARWRKAMAWLRHNKCNNPLMVLVVVAAVVVFVCALVQGVFAVLSYAKGNNS